MICLILPITFSVEEGDFCNYHQYFDSECDPSNNLYCINYYCEFSEKKAPNCLEFDNKIEYIFRDEFGNFITQELNNFCEENNESKENCEGENCNLINFYCTNNRAKDYNYEEIICENGCLNGTCITFENENLDGNNNLIENNDSHNPNLNEINCEEENCEREEIFPPQKVTDEELLNYINKWASNEMTDLEIQIIIEVWKNN